MGREKRTKNSTILLGVIIISCLLMAVLLGYLLTEDNVQITKKREETSAIVLEDVTVTDKMNPAAPLGISKEYTMVLKDNTYEGSYIAFYAIHQCVEAYIDGKLIYSIQPSDKLAIGKTIGARWGMIPLYYEYQGKELKICVSPVYKSMEDRTLEFIVGKSHDIYLYQLKEDILHLLLGVLALNIGLIYVLVGLYNIIFDKKDVKLFGLGVFAIMMGTWKLSDTSVVAFVLAERTVFLFYLSVGMLMLGSIPIVQAIKNSFSAKCKFWMEIGCILTGIAAMIQIILQIVNIVDIRENLFVTHILIVLNIAIIMVSGIYDHVQEKPHTKKRVVFKSPVICLCGVAMDIVMFYFTKTSSELIFSVAGLLIYVIYEGINTLIEYSEQEKRLRKHEEELSNSRISIMLSQIRPHFLYNSISAIGELCIQDPERAREALNDFAVYLRGNMDSIDSKSTIPFAKELKHVETYLSLEKMRFGDDLTIVYDIEVEDFCLPALTIQPLVENAVKHGVCNKENGEGVVILKTCKEDDKIKISIIDNGVGFEYENCINDNKNHIGIQSVKNRLEYMCEGELIIESEIGTGTVATILLNG